jgi:hypothetical protein
MHQLERDLSESEFDREESHLDVGQLQKLCEENDIEYE